MIWYLIKTIKEIIQNKRIVLVTLCCLIICLGGTVYFDRADANNNEDVLSNAAAFGVVDYDGSIYSKMIVNYFKGTDSFMKFASLTEGTEEEIHSEFENGTIDAYLVIPQGFARSLMDGTETKIRAVINTSNTVVSVMLSNMLDSYDTYISNAQLNSFALYRILKESGLTGSELTRANYQTSIALVTKALQRDELFEKNEVTTITHTPMYQYYIWALLSLVIVYSSVLSGMSFLKEISLGTYERLRIIGHSVGNVLLGIMLTNIVIWSVLLCVLTRLLTSYIGIVFPVMAYIYLVLCIVLANVAACLIASICKNKKTFTIISNLGLLCMSILGGVIIPISVMPYRFVELAKVSPNYWIISKFIDFGYEADKQGEVSENYIMVFWMAAASILLYCITLFVISKFHKMKIGGDYEAV